MTIEPTPTNLPAAPTPVAPSIPAGWHPHPENPGLLKYWDGSAWTEHTAPASQPQHASPVTAAAPQVIIQQNIGGGGRGVSHGLHLFLTIITGGLWGVFVWLPLVIINSMRRNKGAGGNYYQAR